MKIEDLDLLEVREMLSKLLASAINSGEISSLPHAWLFSGPRGTGKTSSARILAKALNCEHKSGFEPCNECEMCLEISSGAAMDVIEIDAASNRGIDEIRELKEKIRLAPMRAKYKVYIIDEVHMLTTEAANALLKTLEEPPESTFFVLCTTEPEKLPDTVVSRCTRVTFRKPSLEEGVASLQRVAKGEGMKVEKTALEDLVRAAKGSFRDGTKLLEQVWLSAGEVTEDSVLSVLRMTSGGDATAFSNLISSGKTDEALTMIDKLDKEGINWRRFVESLVEEWREMLLRSLNDKPDEVNKLLLWLSEMDMVHEHMKTSSLPQLPLEMFVISKRVSKVSTPPAKVKQKEESPPAEEEPQAETARVKTDSVLEEEMTVKSSGAGKYGLEDLESKWNDVMKIVRPKNHSVEALLRSTKPLAFDGERIELEVFYKFHKDKLESDRCRTIVESAIGEVFEVSGIKLYLKLGQGQRKKSEEVSAEGVGQDIVQAAEQIFGVEAV
jgi:DNA polymerase-3 subunit gamma/tau